MKLINEQKVGKIILYPENYEKFLEIIRSFTPIKENNKTYDGEGKKIMDKEDFD